MDDKFYQLLHIIGLILVFVGLGGALMGEEGKKAPKLASILHGTGLLVMFVAGFGLLAKRNYAWPWPGWVWAKFVIWVFLGALPTLTRKGVVTKSVGWVVAAGVGGTAAWLALYRPVLA